MIDETAEVCPYCDEPTFFKHSHKKETVVSHTTDYQPAKKGMSLWKKVLIGVACIWAALLVISLLIPDDESEDAVAVDTEQLIDSVSAENPLEDMESINTPYGILSVDDAITLRQLEGLPDKKQRFLVEHGYEYVGTDRGTIEFSDSVGTYEHDEYWAKNCKLGRIKDGYEVMSKSAQSSYIYISDNGYFYINAFDESVFKAWYSQLTSKGYKLINHRGNSGQDWSDEDKYGIVIWNDYGDEYVLSIDEQFD